MTTKRWIASVLAIALLVAGGAGLAVLRVGDGGSDVAEPAGQATEATDGSTSSSEVPAASGCDERLKVVPSDRVLLGAAVPGGLTDPAAVEDFDAAAGTPAALAMWFVDWETPFPTDAVQLAAEEGTIPVLTWEPTTADAGSSTTDLADYRLATIVAGEHDDYIRQFARDAKAACQPAMVRLAAEMNGNWHPWSEGVNGNRPGEYVQAWRHVHDIFRAEGATNVTWVWNPNLVDERSAALDGFYPGDEYTDWVGVDGYNWGDLRTWSRWTSFADLFDRSLAELATFTSLPVLIGEVASTESGGDKAEWISDMYASLAARPAIRGLIWFEYDKETDWRIRSSAAAQAAFARGAADDAVEGAPVGPLVTAGP